MRRDFIAIYQCEHCGHEYEDSGYDDRNFHKNVVPSMKCPVCETTASESYVPRATKWPDGMTV